MIYEKNRSYQNWRCLQLERKTESGSCLRSGILHIEIASLEQVICELANWRRGRGRILIKYIQLQIHIKAKNNGAVIVVYVGSSLTVHNPLFNPMFLSACSVSSK